MDFDEIKRHEFFKNFDWKPLDCARATIVARLARKRLRANPVATERRYLELEWLYDARRDFVVSDAMTKLESTRSYNRIKYRNRYTI